MWKVPEIDVMTFKSFFGWSFVIYYKLGASGDMLNFKRMKDAVHLKGFVMP